MKNAKPIEEVLNEIGYVLQITPAGRQIWSNPKFILTEAELADEDDYADEGWYDRDEDADYDYVGRDGRGNDILWHEED